MRMRDPVFMKRTASSFSSHKRRAKEAGVALDYTLDDLRELVRDALVTPCPYCWRTMTAATFSCDHETPTSRGGSFSIGNVCAIDSDCNQAKGNLDAEEFALLWVALRQMSSDGRTNVIRRLRAGGKIFGGRR